MKENLFQSGVCLRTEDMASLALWFPLLLPGWGGVWDGVGGMEWMGGKGGGGDVGVGGRHLRAEGSFWPIMDIPVSMITPASCCKQTSVSVFAHLCMLRGW